jgi:hypothetical protein
MARGILFSKYRRPRKSFARKAGRRVFRKGTGPVRRGLRAWDRSINRRYARRKLRGGA